MDPADSLLKSAIDHHQAGRFHEAEVIYRRILTDRPDFAEAWRLLGVIALEAHQPDAALEYIQRANQLLPNNPAALVCLAQVYTRRGEPSKALENYERAHSLAPDQAEICFQTAICLAALGRTDEAASSLRKSLELQPGLAGGPPATSSTVSDARPISRGDP